MNTEQFYTVDTVAEKMQATPRWVGDKIRAGELMAYKQGRRFFVLHSDLIDFIRKGKPSRKERKKR